MEEGTSKSPSDRCRTVGDYGVLQWDAREGCEVRRHILNRIADKWSLLVIALLEKRKLRFTELKKSITGISQRMLTTTLRQLERDGIVARQVFPVVPPRVEYALTPLGCTLLETIQALVSWTERNQQEIMTARERYDTRAREDDLPDIGG